MTRFKAGERVSILAIVALALLPRLCMCAGDITKKPFKARRTREELISQFRSGLLSNQRAVTAEDLPESRPPTQRMCDYKCQKHLKISTSPGVYSLDMTYQPMSGVTCHMMTWLMDNLHRSTVSVADNKVYPMYLVFHGVDHLHHERSPDNLAVGTTLSWNEIPLTGCQYDQLSATEPWKCPQGRKGFVRSDPEESWAGLFQTKVEMQVTRYDMNGIEFVRKEENPIFGGDGSRVVAATRHEWRDSPEGLRLRTQQWLGLMAPGSTTTFDTSEIATAVNPIISYVYLSGAQNIPEGNITAAAYMAALHFLQEYGSLKTWLPRAYRTNNVIR